VFLGRSVKGRWHHLAHSRLTILERLVDGGFFKNNRQMIVSCRWPSIYRLCQSLRSMTHLETLNVLHWTLRLKQDVPQLFRSCPKLTELRLKLAEAQNFEMGEELKNELRSGFQRLRLVELHWDIPADSWPVVQEMFT